MTLDTAIAEPEGWARHSDWIDGVEAISWSAGQGRPIVLIHGIGPGTCGLANFEPVLDTLLQHGEVHLIDLIGFGASGRKNQAPYFDVGLWQRQLQTLLRRIGRPATRRFRPCCLSVRRSARRHRPRRCWTSGVCRVRLRPWPKRWHR
jgi:pimeloyl-ACP methyl ester carboxylesterase